MGASNVKWVRLGDYIEQCDERNSASINYPVIGINRDKTFMPTVANLDGVDIAKYKLDFDLLLEKLRGHTQSKHGTKFRYHG